MDKPLNDKWPGTILGVLEQFLSSVSSVLGDFKLYRIGFAGVTQ